MPVVSVIVPIYNVEEYLERCVDSILNQTFTDFELILVDDGSTDNSGQICDEYAESDERVKVIHKENGGLSDARNAGIDVSTGQYMMFVDSDDYIDPKMIEILYERILKDGSDIAVCNLLSVDENGNFMKDKNKTMAISEDSVYSGEQFLYVVASGYVTACTKLYKSEIFDSIRFPKGKLNEDVFVSYQTVERCKLVSCVAKALYFYRKRNTSIMNSSYSIRRLDAVEGYIVMAETLFVKGFCRAAGKALLCSVILLDEGYRNLDLKVKPNRKRIKELRAAIMKKYHQVIFAKTSLKTKIHLTVFCISLPFHSAYLAWRKRARSKDEQK